MPPPFSVPYNHWINRFIAWVFCFTALVLSAVAVKSCQFLKVTEATAGGNVGSIAFTGIYRFLSTSGTCVSWSLIVDASPPPNNVELDASHKSAQAFGVVAPVLGAVAMFLLLSTLYCKLGKCAWRTIACLCFAAFVFQGLTFILFNADFCKKEEEGATGSVKCNVDEGGNIAIAAMVFYLLAGMVVCCTPSPESAVFVFDFQKDGTPQGSHKTTTREQHETAAAAAPTMATIPPAAAAGLMTSVTKEIIHPDGTKTTTTTFESQQPEQSMADSDVYVDTGDEQPAAYHKRLVKTHPRTSANDMGGEQPTHPSHNLMAQHPTYDASEV